MKRFLAIFLSVLLILPVLLLPCLAASEYQFSYWNTGDTGVSFLCTQAVQDGLYRLSFYASGSLVGETDSFSLSYRTSEQGQTASVVVPFRSAYPNLNGNLPLKFVSDGSSTAVLIPNIIGAQNPQIYYFVLSPVQKSTFVLNGLSSVAQSVIGWVGQIAAVIVSRPFLFFTVGILFLGGCIGIFSRFLSRE